MVKQTDDDLHAPFDCWEDEGPWDDLRDEPKARQYANIVAAVKERIGYNDEQNRGREQMSVIDLQEKVAEAINHELEHEYEILSESPAVAPHSFQGRTDRWCEICDFPDRHPIHKSAATTGPDMTQTNPNQIVS